MLMEMLIRFDEVFGNGVENTGRDYNCNGKKKNIEFIINWFNCKLIS